MMDQLELRSAVGTAACDEFLAPIISVPLPAPGGSIQFSAPMYKKGAATGEKETYCFRRPDEDESTWDYVNLQPLLYLLDPVSILELFSSILIERRIIFVAGKLSTLSSCVQAIVALLYPFSWQHIFIPVLPKSMINMCAAPMPFMVGVLRSCIPELNKIGQSMEEDTIAFDLDSNRFLSSQGGDRDLLSPDVEPGLSKALAAACKIVKGQASMFGTVMRLAKQNGDVKSGEMNRLDAQDLKNAFTGFFADLLRDYRKYMVKNGAFKKDAFVASQNEQVRPLLEQFVQSQMFERFVFERQSRGLTNGTFENRVTMTVQALSAAGAGGGKTSSRREKMGRFTMYEMGELTRDELTQTHQEMLRLEKEREKEQQDRERETQRAEREREQALQLQQQQVLNSGAKPDGVKPEGAMRKEDKALNRRSGSSRGNNMMISKALLAHIEEGMTGKSTPEKSSQGPPHTSGTSAGSNGMYSTNSSNSGSNSARGVSTTASVTGGEDYSIPVPPPAPGVSTPQLVVNKLKSGFLMKYPGHNVTKLNANLVWREKWVVLTKTGIRYSKLPVEKDKGGEIELTDVTECTVESTHSLLKKDNVIVLTTPAGVYHFQAASLDEANSWCDTINSCRTKTRNWLSKVGQTSTFNSIGPRLPVGSTPLPGIASKNTRIATKNNPGKTVDAESLQKRSEAPVAVLPTSDMAVLLQPFGRRNASPNSAPGSLSTGSSGSVRRHSPEPESVHPPTLQRSQTGPIQSAGSLPVSPTPASSSSGNLLSPPGSAGAANNPPSMAHLASMGGLSVSTNLSHLGGNTNNPVVLPQTSATVRRGTFHEPMLQPILTKSDPSLLKNEPSKESPRPAETKPEPKPLELRQGPTPPTPPAASMKPRPSVTHVEVEPVKQHSSNSHRRLPTTPATLDPNPHPRAVDSSEDEGSSDGKNTPTGSGRSLPIIPMNSEAKRPMAGSGSSHASTPSSTPPVSARGNVPSPVNNHQNVQNSALGHRTPAEGRSLPTPPKASTTN